MRLVLRRLRESRVWVSLVVNCNPSISQSTSDPPPPPPSVNIEQRRKASRSVRVHLYPPHSATGKRRSSHQSARTRTRTREVLTKMRSIFLKINCPPPPPRESGRMLRAASSFWICRECIQMKALMDSLKCDCTRRATASKNADKWLKYCI